MRRFTFWAVALAVLVIVLFNVQGWLVFSRTSRVLENELGDRLQAVATALASALEGRYDAPGTRELLSTVMEQNDLFSLFVVDESLRYLVNTRAPELEGANDPSLDLDAAEILAAFSGVPTRSRLYSAGGYYLKSAFAPLADSAGAVTAVLGVEADARFFSTLTVFRNSLFLSNVLSLIAIAAVVLVSVSLARRALEMERAAGRAGTMALLGQLSAAMAHDIRNPLAIIRAAAERLKKKYGSADDPTFDYIPEEVDRLNRVVTNYLGLGAAKPGELEQVDVGEMLAELLRDTEHETKKHSIAVEAKLEGLPAVQGSRVELRQAFLNIVLNAIQAQHGGGRLLVSGRSERARGRDWLVVTFEDRGPGIPKEALGRVFEPFYTTKEKGSGLGLFSVKRAVEAHKGRVAIRSEAGKGTTVEVRIPKAE